MGRSRLAVVIPALNEERLVGEVVAAAVAFGWVIVVDDCSTDRTGQVAADAGATVIQNQTRLGYDGALECGFAEADRGGCEAVVTMDADGEHDPELLAKFSDLLLTEKIPLVLGVRQKKQRFAEFLIGHYVRRRYGVADILCGMKGYRIELYGENGGFDHSRSIGSELTLNSIRRGHAFRELPVRGRQRQDRPRFGNSLSANFRILRALLRAIRISDQSPSSNCAV